MLLGAGRSGRCFDGQRRRHDSRNLGRECIKRRIGRTLTRLELGNLRREAINLLLQAVDLGDYGVNSGLEVIKRLRHCKNLFGNECQQQKP